MEQKQVPLLETRNLKKYFKVKNGFLHAVDDISLRIDQGHTLGVVGESGCGKSTLGRTILRLIEPSAGEILFQGKDITKCSKKEMRAYRSQMQIIFQDPYSSINPRLSVLGVLVTQFTHMADEKEALAAIRGGALPVFETVIRFSKAVPSATFQKVPLPVARPYCAASKDYAELVKEISGRC